MGDKTKGLYDKFRVTRVDGSHKAGNRHYGCEYFVLDLTHDPHALPAIAAYSVSCEADYPLLAADLKLKCGHILAEWELRNIERDARLAELEELFQKIPEGCTPADAAMLRDANHALAAQGEELLRAVRENLDRAVAAETELERVKREWVPLYAGNKGNP